MPTNRPNATVNRTLLILLGIILAFLLTINARSFYSAESFSLPKGKQTDLTEKKVTLDLLKSSAESTFRIFVERIQSIK